MSWSLWINGFLFQIGMAIGFVYAMYNGDSGFLQGHSFERHGLQASTVVFFKDSFGCRL
jgi:hypothetical protein